MKKSNLLAIGLCLMEIAGAILSPANTGDKLVISIFFSVCIVFFAIAFKNVKSHNTFK